MCQKTVKMVGRTAALLLAVFILAEGAAGSCLSYGHACLGAHGKRSGGGTSDNSEATEWFLSRLMSPPDLRYAPRGGAPPKTPEDDPDREETLDAKTGSTEWEQLREYLRNANPPSVEISRGDESRFLEKRSIQTPHHQTTN